MFIYNQKTDFRINLLHKALYSDLNQIKIICLLTLYIFGIPIGVNTFIFTFIQTILPFGNDFLIINGSKSFIIRFYRWKCSIFFHKGNVILTEKLLKIILIFFFLVIWVY